MLQPMELRVDPVEREQLVVGAGLHDSPVPHHDDPVGVPDRAQPD